MPNLKVGDLLAKPAYGRIYPDITSMRNAWEWGQDFRIVDGPYFSIRDLEHIKKESQ